jgi:hypothetical protein
MSDASADASNHTHLLHAGFFCSSLSTKASPRLGRGVPCVGLDWTESFGCLRPNPSSFVWCPYVREHMRCRCVADCLRLIYCLSTDYLPGGVFIRLRDLLILFEEMKEDYSAEQQCHRLRRRLLYQPTFCVVCRERTPMRKSSWFTSAAMACGFSEPFITLHTRAAARRILKSVPLLLVLAVPSLLSQQCDLSQDKYSRMYY